jgi:ubiquitin carboxyl-terminal hydrolase 5/13
MPLLKDSNGPFAKDSCHFCFATAFEGLFISTASNRAYCANHISLHRDQYLQDEYYIKVQKTRKKQQKQDADGERQHKILKLEINYQNDSDLYNITHQLVHYYRADDDNDGTVTITNVNDSDIDASTQSIIDKVIRSTSAAKSKELQSWQLEIQPCPHTLSYQPAATPPHVDLSNLKCSNCDLDQNLWLCLVCGSLGCGRAQFGGVPGNTHALAHSDATGHAIAVKLGSLSKDVADVYCYKCDEEVSFPQGLDTVLQLFGIDLNNFEKKEKGLMELQIEQNLEWEFNLKGAHGEDLQKLFGPGLTGMKNLGNSCYLNSVAQLLFAIPEYQEKFNVPLLAESQDDDETLQFELIKLANGLLSGHFSKPNNDENDGFQRGISPESIKYKISEGHEEFRSMKQQDSMEFLYYLLDKIDKIDPDLNDIFRFINVEILKIDDNKIKLKRQLSESLSLPIQVEILETDQEDGKKIYKRQSFIDALSNYLKPEQIELNSKIAYKSNYFQTFPKYLLTTTQRIQLDKNWNPIKVDVPLTIPDEFDLRDLQPSKLIQPNETEIHDDEDLEEEEEEEEEFQPNKTVLDQLLQMGFPFQRSKRALFETNNNSNAEEVMDWLFQRMEDSSLDDETFNFKTLKKSSSSSSKTSQPAAAAAVNQDQVQNLGDMGFSAKLATKALILNNHDVNAAVEWLFSNPTDDGELHTEEQEQSPVFDADSKLTKLEHENNEGAPASSRYVLKSVVCHKGTQVTSGHYVAFVKDETSGKWALFNDEKVVDVTSDEKSWEEIEKNGYIYLWKRV